MGCVSKPGKSLTTSRGEKTEPKKQGRECRPASGRLSHGMIRKWLRQVDWHSKTSISFYQLCFLTQKALELLRRQAAGHICEGIVVRHYSTPGESMNKYLFLPECEPGLLTRAEMTQRQLYCQSHSATTHHSWRPGACCTAYRQINTLEWLSWSEHLSCSCFWQFSRSLLLPGQTWLRFFTTVLTTYNTVGEVGENLVNLVSFSNFLKLFSVVYFLS